MPDPNRPDRPVRKPPPPPPSALVTAVNPYAPGAPAGMSQAPIPPRSHKAIPLGSMLGKY